MSEEKQGQVTGVQWVALVLLFALSLFLASILRVSLYEDSSESSYSAVSEFLTQYLSVSESDSLALENYFLLPDSTLLQQFEDVIGPPYYGYTRFELEPVSDGFVKIRFYIEDTLLAPVIGFWYEISSSQGKISEWRIARLQPFSVYDAEYSEVWDD